MTTGRPGVVRPYRGSAFIAVGRDDPGAPFFNCARSAHITCSLFIVHHSLFTKQDVRGLSRAADSRPYKISFVCAADTSVIDP